MHILQHRSSGREDWSQFELSDPESEANALAQLEASLRLKRGWNVNGAANVYFRVKSTLSVVGQDFVAEHRFRHRRRVGNACAKTCAARDLYAYCLLCLPTDLHPRVMPISSILGHLVARAFEFEFCTSASFHREVMRDLRRLGALLDRPTSEHTSWDKSFVLRYAGSAAVLSANPERRARIRSRHRTI